MRCLTHLLNVPSWYKHHGSFIGNILDVNEKSLLTEIKIFPLQILVSGFNLYIMASICG